MGLRAIRVIKQGQIVLWFVVQTCITGLPVRLKFESHQGPHCFSLRKKLYPQCSELVGSRNRLKPDSQSNINKLE